MAPMIIKSIYEAGNSFLIRNPYWTGNSAPRPVTKLKLVI